jgi:hypothetical protein
MRDDDETYSAESTSSRTQSATVVEEDNYFLYRSSSFTHSFTATAVTNQHAQTSRLTTLKVPFSNIESTIKTRANSRRNTTQKQKQSSNNQ